MSATFWTADQVKEYIESILNEKDRALSMADDEREKAASALRNEQQRALDQADRERERAADKLRTELARQIDEGDDRLREHIAQQFQQINAALVSAERLETTRFGSTTEAVFAMKEQIEVLRKAAVIAQDKFERSVESRFAQVNEFRGSLDDLSQKMATRRELESLSTSIIAKVEDLGGLVQELRSRMDVGPAGLGELRSRADMQQGRSAGMGQSWGMVVAAVGLIATVLGIVIVLANVLTTH